MGIKPQKLLFEIPEGEYVTAEVIAARLGVGVKTVRARISDLNDALSGNGALIAARQRHGYTLEITDRVAFDNFLSGGYGATKGQIPSTPEERQSYILWRFVNSREYLKLDDIADELFVSKASVSNDLKQVEEVLAKFKLELERRPHYGVRLSGLERRIRRLIGDYLENGEFPELLQSNEPVSYHEVRAEVARLISKHSLVFYHAAYERLCLQMFLSIWRIYHGFTTENDGPFSFDSVVDDKLLLIADDMVKSLSLMGRVNFSRPEFACLVLELHGKCSVEDSHGGDGLRISERIQQLVVEMLDDIYEEFGVDLRADLDLRVSLGLHLVPFDIRMKYDMPLSNPITEDIKKHYVFGYTIATRACAPLAKYYGHEIPEDEIAYITPFIVLAMEKRDREKHRKRVLLVCPTGKASSQLLAYKFRDEFDDYLESVDIKDVFTLSHSDISAYDCIFSTVPIPFEVSKPVFEVSQFLLQNEVSRVRRYLSRRADSAPTEYFSRDMFFTDIRARDRRGIISEICTRIAAVYPLPDGFEGSIVKRENFFSTDYGNLVAFPHPMQMMCDDTFVSVAVLDEPVMWGRNPVQVVLTVSISRNGDTKERLKKFYAMTGTLITEESSIRRLIAKPCYETLIDIVGGVSE